MPVRRVALLTAGGFAPCLSSAVGGLIERYTQVAPEVEIIAYQHGYHGLLTGNTIVVDDDRVPGQQAVVAMLVGDDLHLGGDLRVPLDEPADGRGQARGETAGGEKSDATNRHGLCPSGGRSRPGSRRPAMLGTDQLSARRQPVAVAAPIILLARRHLIPGESARRPPASAAHPVRSRREP